ncbi:MAG: hypothetical protein COV43_06075 [Deltaproteobacteria bacterium CG11_big_fil_rev_8_21_14_0_20_42_23]|nr:MAG: hypothetical protein COV43_06075 [Deltaproteobacteria bacterium CG11_big_fil_rev_8_21_14_0_20_42_23]PJC65159.1 MAG: hypothetical protein CO021_00470 [Deltaproteobacteria bacterium CG_4_9_14_0_2_um_filter_42_21]
MKSEIDQVTKRESVRHFKDETQKLKEQAFNVGQAAYEAADDSVKHLKENSSHYLKEAKSAALNAEKKLEETIKERPLSALLISAAAGFVIASFFKLRK